MSFRGVTSDQYKHGQQRAIGIVLGNLGTPDAPTAKALRPYLKQFLSDQRVIELNPIKWGIILNAFILTFRPKKSAALYRKIWTEQGSPLLVHTRAIRDELEQALRESFNAKFFIEIGMRYGNPSIDFAIEKLLSRNVDRILVLPLFPQYSATTNGTLFDEVTRVLTKYREVPEFRMTMRYHDDSRYIEALANSIEEVWEQDGKPQKLMFSFHGIPKRYYVSGDPYPCYCMKTGRLVAERLGLSKDEYIVCFQSLFGKEEWVKPYTIDTVSDLAKSGLKRLDVVCPGFTTDCLETLEEIDVENRKAFMESGGEKFRYIPSLNSRGDFIAALTSIVAKNCSGWELTETAHPFPEISKGAAER